MGSDSVHDWSVRLRRVMAWKELSAAELGRRTQLSKDSVYKYMQGRVAQPRGDILRRIAEAMGVSEHWLRDGTGPQYLRLPLVGYVGAGEAFVPYDDLASGASLEEIEFDVGSGDPIAVMVRGRSMEPVYRPGDILVCTRQAASDPDAYVGRDCVVLLDDGEGYIKRVMPGTEPGRFNLVSYAAPAINDATLVWAAPVVWVRRSP